MTWKIFKSEQIKSCVMDTWLAPCIITSKGREIYQVKKILTEYFNIKIDFFLHKYVHKDDKVGW